MVFILLLLMLCAKLHEVTMQSNEGSLVIFIDPGFTCNDGTRIRGSQLCNNKKDCSQNEDETFCTRTKSNFRVHIKLMEPYFPDYNNHSSPIFKIYENKMIIGVKEIFSKQDVVTARLVAVLTTTDLSQSKAVVDLEFSSVRSRKYLEDTLSAWLADHKKIDSLAASPSTLYVRDFGENRPFQCSSTEIPCKDSDKCIPSSGRCDKTTTCPDNSDEEECPSPNSEREDYQLTDISDDGYLSLMSDNGDLREDLKVPEGELGAQLKSEYNGGKELLCTVLKSNGEERVIAFKINSALNQ